MIFPHINLLLFFALLMLPHTETSAFIEPPKHTAKRNPTPLSWSKSTVMDNNGVETAVVNCLVFKVFKFTYDTSSPREWLQYWEMERGHQGAYTVLRCDFDLRTKKWKVWGRGFHFRRLQDSYLLLVNSSTASRVSQTPTEETIDNSRASSERAIKVLLDEAEKEILSSSKFNDMEEKRVVTIMMALLWHPRGDGEGIEVLGHASSALLPWRVLDYSPNPVDAVAAVSSDDKNPLPNRYEELPGAKLSSWCRRREPLEEEFKTNGAGEVLLTRSAVDGGIELLEGLTTNVFFVYPGGVLCTPPAHDALSGYSRHLVLEYAKQNNLKVETRPVKLEESSLWQEVFLTSSIRLIAPVGKIIVEHAKDPSNDHDRDTIWTADPKVLEPLWWKLYEGIVGMAVS